MPSILPTDQMHAVLSAMPDLVFILTRSGRYSAVYGGTDVRYYHDGSSLIGTRISDMVVAEKAQWFLAQIDATLRERSLQIVEYSLAGSDVKGLNAEGPSQPIWFEGRVQALPFEVDGEDAVLWVSSNITARRELEDKLRLLSETDPLTGLYNRRKLMATLEAQFQICARYATPTAVLIFDIDHFKRINDEHGHQAGDSVLTAVANVCRAELRVTDIAARLGGDEFVILMPETTQAQAAPFAERLRLMITELLKVLTRGLEAGTVSAGLSELLVGDVGIDDVMARADRALYQAKRSGRNRIVLHDAASACLPPD